MMRVQFTKDYQREGEPRPRKAGELLDVPDDEATALIAEGLAKLHRFGPTETKRKEPQDPDDTSVPLEDDDGEDGDT